MTVQKPLSLALLLSYFSCSFVFAILITIGLSVVYLGTVSNPALSRMNAGSFVVGMLFLNISLIAASWFAYLPLRRHPRIIRAVTAAFAVAVLGSLVFIVLIDWG
ncbi:hypothetical protein AB4Z52_32610 [Rhizobium sp. 2YAF20]|uniref:hypothetical protein n=1 Tax=Rhizobium sp. 2YAF20 TaxID=3233027 RepID=UPI003F949F02